MKFCNDMMPEKSKYDGLGKRENNGAVAYLTGSFA